MLQNSSSTLFTTQANASSTPYPHDLSTPNHIHEHHVHVNAAFVIQQVILSVIVLIGIVGNILVCYTVIKQNQIKHNTWYYLCSLSITDFLVCIFNVPVLMYAKFDEDIIDTDTLLCKINAFCLVFFLLSSVLTLAMISFHKLLYIKHPLYWRSCNQSLKFIAAVWILSFVIAVSPFLGWSEYTHVHGRKQCIPAAHQTVLDLSYLAVILFFGFLLPLTSMIICYTFVFTATRKHQKRMKRNSIGHGGESRSMRDRAIIKTIIIIVLAFCICWAPFVVYIFFNFTGTPIPLELTNAAFILAYAQSALNPIIYALRHKLFREHFKSIICCSTYFNIEVVRDPSSTVAVGTGTPFTVESQRNVSATKLVHYRRKYSTQQRVSVTAQPSQSRQTKNTTTKNKCRSSLGRSLSHQGFFEKQAMEASPPSSYFNGVFQLSE